MRPAISGSSLATRHAMPLMIAAFCLLWSSAFAVAKLALADCPPLLLLTARFLLAGGLMLTVAAAGRRTVASFPSRHPGACRPWRRQ
jgi:drug/metabolite transporter (DMT)-like permease